MLGRPQGTHCKSGCGLTPWYLKHENYYYYYAQTLIHTHTCTHTSTHIYTHTHTHMHKWELKRPWLTMTVKAPTDQLPSP